MLFLYCVIVDILTFVHTWSRVSESSAFWFSFVSTSLFYFVIFTFSWESVHLFQGIDEIQLNLLVSLPQKTSETVSRGISWLSLSEFQVPPLKAFVGIMGAAEENNRRKGEKSKTLWSLQPSFILILQNMDETTKYSKFQLVNCDLEFPLCWSNKQHLISFSEFTLQ